MTWSETILQALKDNDVRLVSYVPDNVLTPLINGVIGDNYFMSVCATREDEALGVVAGAWMGGTKGCVMMQTSGFAVAPNAIASLIVPFQIPASPSAARSASSTAARRWWRAPCGLYSIPSR